MFFAPIINYDMLTLDKGLCGKEYQIVSLCEENNITRRFFELGFAVGQKVKILATSLLGKAYLVQIRGYVLSVRATLLKQIMVEDV